MKTKLLLTLTALTAGVIAFAESPSKNNLVVHEWGTFTSLQGGDGKLITWKPLVTSELPRFVYDWPHAGLGRFSQTLAFGKGSLVTLQRMETPVVYFYSDKALTADLSVRFPKGLITEWFPQARQIGPSVVMRPPNSPPTASENITNSLIHWSNIRILPPDATASLPTDTNGAHYFAARETDANLVRLDSLAATNTAQYEKFLFYRGVGSFPTPLKVTMKSYDAVTLSNTGKEPLKHLFVLDVKDKSGAFIYVDQLLPGEEKKVFRPEPATFLAPASLAGNLSTAMSDSLVKAGLYPREAAAMVNTWKKSWFAENGTRVLYVLPRAWTDATLPMTLTPAPRELTRVMVGRAELLTPAVEQNLAQELDKARAGDPFAPAEVHQIARDLGRFAEPAFNRAIATLKPENPDLSKMAAVFYSRKRTGFE